MIRGLYQSLLWLHPPAFRRQFAGEMLWIFDEASAGTGSFALFSDVVLSLARQWLIGCGAWKVVLAMMGGIAEMVLAALLITGLEPFPPYPVHHQSAAHRQPTGKRVMPVAVVSK